MRHRWSITLKIVSFLVKDLQLCVYNLKIEVKKIYIDILNVTYARSIHNVRLSMTTRTHLILLITSFFFNWNKCAFGISLTFLEFRNKCESWLSYQKRCLIFCELICGEFTTRAIKKCDFQMIASSNIVIHVIGCKQQVFVDILKWELERLLCIGLLERIWV